MRLSVLVAVCLTVLTPRCQADETASTASDNTSPSRAETRQTAAQDLAELMQSGDWEVIEVEELRRLRGLASGEESVRVRPGIRMARYSAELNDSQLLNGTAELQLYPDQSSVAELPLALGRTDLQQLRIFDVTGETPLGSDLERNLYVLRRSLSGNLTGSWTADGLVTGETTAFRLNLPRATQSSLRLTTPTDVLVTGSGSLVMEPEQTDDGLLWTLLPSSPDRLAFSCRRLRRLTTQDPISLTSATAGHTLLDNILSSRWILGLPVEIGNDLRVSMKLTAGTRISQVQLNSGGAADWEIIPGAPFQTLRVRLPSGVAGGQLEIRGISVISEEEVWSLPVLTPDHWELVGDHPIQGPLLSPNGAITVSFPPGTDVDEWELKGVLERDVVTTQDQFRKFELLRFGNDASARVRISRKQARLSDSVVTVVEPSSRLAAVRCFVNVSCQEASVIEVWWPLRTGWQLISARYASDQRVLYYEVAESSTDDQQQRLTLHLPETLAPDSSRVIEMLIQNTQGSGSTQLQMPLLQSPDIERRDSFLIVPETVGMQRQAARPEQRISEQELSGLAGWFPAAKIPNGSQILKPKNDEYAVLPRKLVADVSPLQLRQRLRIEGEILVQETRCELPEDFTGNRLPFVLPGRFLPQMKWFVNSRQVTPREDQPSLLTDDMQRISIPLPADAENSGFVVTAKLTTSLNDSAVAVVPFPEADQGAEIRLEMSVADSERLLLQEPALELSQEAGTSIRHWNITGVPRPIRLRVQTEADAGQERSLDMHLYHLLRIRGSDIHHRIMAVADLSGRSVRENLTIGVVDGVIPSVLVDGRRVHTTLTDKKLLIPLPPAAERCRVVLVWEQPVLALETIDGRVRLASPSVEGAMHVMTVHHLLISPDLDARIPASRFRFREGGLTRGQQLAAVGDAGNSSRFVDLAEIRGFHVEWELSEAQGWTMQTLVSADSGKATMVLELTEKRRRSAVLAGSILFSLGLCLALQKYVLRRPRFVAFFVLVLSMSSVLSLPSLVSVGFQGIFWGTGAGLLLLISVSGIAQQFRLWTHRRGLFQWLLLAALQCSACSTASGQQSADTVDSRALTAAGFLEESGLVYLPQDELEQLRRQVMRNTAVNQQTLVTGCLVEIRCDSADSVELLLKISVSSQSGKQQSILPLPIGQSKLVDCRVDGQFVFPDPASDERLLIPIPSSVSVSGQRLSPESSVAVETAADDVAAFTTHEVECRLRPRISRLQSGLKFSLPALPCPQFEMLLKSSDDFFKSARIQLADATVPWGDLKNTVPLNTLADDDSAEVSLLYADNSIESEASVSLLAVCENSTGLQHLSCYFHVSEWNPLKGDLRYRIPADYQLTGGAIVGGDNSAEVLWQVNDSDAVITLPSGISSDFVLLLQLRSRTPTTLQEQIIPVEQLQNVDGVSPSSNVLVAWRADSVSTAFLPDRNAAEQVQFSELAEDWGRWIRRSDTLLRVAATEPFALRSAERKSRHTVSIEQRYDTGEQLLNWQYSFDVEASLLPVFRHQIRVTDAVRVRTVRVMAGEANRLSGWYRRGNDLIVQLREGTTEAHSITIAGERLLTPEDTSIELFSPVLANSSVLESILVLQDNSGLGLVLDDVAESIADPSVESGKLIPAGQEVRLQIPDEQAPIRLRRVNPVDATGRLVTIALPDQIVVICQVSRWSTQLGRFILAFSPECDFLQLPVVLADGQRFELSREIDRFSPNDEALGGLFLKSEFMVVWSVPISAAESEPQSSGLEWPQWNKDLKWQSWEHWITGSSSSQTPPPLIPLSVEERQWAVDAAEMLGLLSSGIFVREVVTGARAKLTESGNLPRLPAFEAEPEAGTASNLYAVSMTSVLVREDDSPAAMTEFRIFSRRWPARCRITIPEDTVVLDLPTDSGIRWESSDRRHLILQISEAETRLRLRWLATRAAQSPFALKVGISLPFVADCDLRQSLSIVSSYREVPSVRGVEVSLTAEAQLAELGEDLRRGYRDYVVSGSADASNYISTSKSAVAELTEASAAFLNEQGAGREMRRIRQRPGLFANLAIYYRRRLELSTILPVGLGLFVLMVATIATSSRRSSEAVTMIIGPRDDLEMDVEEVVQVGADTGFHQPDPRASTKILHRSDELLHPDTDSV